jgi:hypothetical protein
MLSTVMFATRRESTGVEFGGGTMSKVEGAGDDALAYLTTLPNEPLAEMWAETLRRNGIEVLVKPLGPGFGAWGSNFSFDHELYVLTSHHDQAKAILADLTVLDDEADER